MTTEDQGVSAHERRVRHLPAELREEAVRAVCHISMCSASLLRDAADEIERLRAGAESVWRAGFDAGAAYGVAEDRYDPQQHPEHERPERPQNPYAA